MLRYTILLTVIMVSVTTATAADIGSGSKVFYEKYLPDGRVVKILKNTSFQKYPKRKKTYEWPKEWPDNMKIIVTSPVWQIDNYSMSIINGNSENITVWEKEIKTDKSRVRHPGRDKYLNFTVHDIQIKDDRAVIFFSDGKLMLETLGRDTDGIWRVLSGKCLDPNRQTATYLPTVTKGHLVWLDNGLYIITKTVTGLHSFWVLRSDKSEKDIFSQISGPFSLHVFISEKGQSGSQAE